MNWLTSEVILRGHLEWPPSLTLSGSDIFEALYIPFQVLFKKACNRRIGDKTVRSFDKSVSLIIKTQVLDWNVVCAQRCDNLFSLSHRNARIIRAMYDTHWCFDTLY